MVQPYLKIQMFCIYLFLLLLLGLLCVVLLFTLAFLVELRCTEVDFVCCVRLVVFDLAGEVETTLLGILDFCVVDLLCCDPLFGLTGLFVLSCRTDGEELRVALVPCVLFLPEVGVQFFCTVRPVDFTFPERGSDCLFIVRFLSSSCLFLILLFRLLNEFSGCITL